MPLVVPSGKPATTALMAVAAKPDICGDGLPSHLRSLVVQQTNGQHDHGGQNAEPDTSCIQPPEHAQHATPLHSRSRVTALAAGLPNPGPPGIGRGLRLASAPRRVGEGCECNPQH